MKRFLFITLFPLLLPWLCPARPEVSDSAPATIGRFERAYAEMAAMLDGRTPLSIKRAVFLAEWAYAGERLDYGRYCQEIDFLAGNIPEFIAANHLERFSTGGNIALFEFFTGPYSMNGHVPFEYDFEDYSGEGESVELFVTKLLRTHRGQCRSPPLLYKILADEIGAEAYIAYVPNHSFIRQGRRDFIAGSVDLTASSMQSLGDMLSTAGYAASMTGLGAEAGVPLVAVGNAMKYTGAAIDIATDYMSGNVRRATYNVGTSAVMHGLGILPYNMGL